MTSQHPGDLLNHLACYQYALTAVARLAINDPDTTTTRHTIDLLDEDVRRVSRQLAERLMPLWKERPATFPELPFRRAKPATSPRRRTPRTTKQRNTETRKGASYE